ncbi:hypothetical protein KMW28_26440 [Flammeovirga yaeyamensis]|uniref:DUF3887 domain-containing protein n=1 Tax=Flammeovirga yaeyamensis TaxID=367791 RepID=A0AAX1NAE9_9BACT|nr:hypothetical protein [Flammeovirga yaeyamensis]MBB3699157.1 hypothetical protein [Flammeovirga yaeyamensis]NMF35579.1 hypothetical protein [Flammeovirga yaeyamensis]QWG04437.1 hypothetical protein KMW28_26440 [Flammeovirga yaeyamensis]
MSKKLIIFSIVLLISNAVFSQEFDEISKAYFPDQEVVDNAESQVQTSLLQLQDSLEFNKRAVKLRKFDLDLRIDFSDKEIQKKYIKSIKNNEQMMTYKYVHQPYKTGVGYVITYSFDQYGNIMNKEIALMIIYSCNVN